VRRLLRWLIGRREYPLRLMLDEILGNLAGPWALWRSHRRVKRLGRSAVPLALESGDGATAGL
jgi:hypothetical protein